MAWPYREWDFEGCEKLHRMSASWFASYCYHEHLDWYENHWENSPYAKSRITTYDNTRHYHAQWLAKIQCLEAKYLSKNKIGMSGWDVRKMAKTLLQRNALERTAPDPYSGESGKTHLKDIGEAWFVSYMFYDKVDAKHFNWALGKKWFSISTYKASRPHHHEWLEEIAWNPPDDLGDNKIGLSTAEIVGMAKLMLGMGF